MKMKILTSTKTRAPNWTPKLDYVQLLNLQRIKFQGESLCQKLFGGYVLLLYELSFFGSLQFES